MHIETLRVGDNFTYVLIAGTHAAVVDPGVADPVVAYLDEKELMLDVILLTHYHGDHTGGVAALRRTGCEVVGPANGAVEVDRTVVHGSEIDISGHAISAIAVPGHTAHDTAYYLPEAGALFTGDVLFACGCGRMFGRDAHQMWGSLCRLRGLPDDTLVYGGHDYTLENLRFAADLEPENAVVRERLDRFRVNPAAALPSTLAEEKRTNPFLRCDTEPVAAAAGLPGHTAAEVFAAVRARKDRW